MILTAAERAPTRARFFGSASSPKHRIARGAIVRSAALIYPVDVGCAGMARRLAPLGSKFAEVLSTIPIVALYVVGRRHLVSGLTADFSK
jgi:hypothetical protein